MIGKVLAVNAENGYVAVRAPGGITVFEMLGGNEVVKGDLIRGDFESLTGELFFNETRSDDKISVVVQDVNCSPDDATNCSTAGSTLRLTAAHSGAELEIR